MFYGMKYFVCLACGLLFVAGLSTTWAEDFVTTDGRTFPKAEIVRVTQDGIVISTGGNFTTLLKFSELPEETQIKYRYDDFEVMLQKAENYNGQVTNHLTDAFTLSQLEEAKKKAAAEHKLLGFVMVWGQYFGTATSLLDQGGDAATAHFYYVFKDDLVLVYVRHETELGKVPDAVKKGFFGPDEGGFAPNMAVTDSTATTFICEIPFAGKNREGRTKLFRVGIEKIRLYLAHGTSSVAAPAGTAASTTAAAPTDSTNASTADATPVKADEVKVITLKSGAKVIGSIDTTQNMEGITFVNLSINGEPPKIKTVSEDQIASIAPATGEEDPAYKLMLGDESKEVGWYQNAITKQFKPWFLKYPESPHKQEMEAKLAAFQDELYQVQQGNHRKGSQWQKTASLTATNSVAPTPQTNAVASTNATSVATPVPVVSTNSPTPSSPPKVSPPKETLRIPAPPPTPKLNIRDVAAKMLYTFLFFPQNFKSLVVVLFFSVLVVFIVLVQAEVFMNAYSATGWSGIGALAGGLALLLFGGAALYIYGYEGMVSEATRQSLFLTVKGFISPLFPRFLWDSIILGLVEYVILIVSVAPLTAWLFKSSWIAAVISWMSALVCGALLALCLSSWMSGGDNINHFKIPPDESTVTTSGNMQDLTP